MLHVICACDTESSFLENLDYEAVANASLSLMSSGAMESCLNISTLADEAFEGLEVFQIFITSNDEAVDITMDIVTVFIQDQTLG